MKTDQPRPTIDYAPNDPQWHFIARGPGRACGAERARLLLAVGWGLLSLACISGAALLFSNDPFRFIAAPMLSLISMGIASPVTLVLFILSRKCLHRTQASGSAGKRNLRILSAWTTAGLVVSAMLILLGGPAVLRLVATAISGR